MGDILVGVLSIVLGIGILGFFLENIFMSSIVWGPVVLTLFIAIRLFVNNKIFKMRPQSKLARTLPINFNREELRWSLDKNQDQALSGTEKPVWAAAFLASFVVILTFISLHLSITNFFPDTVWFLADIKITQTGYLVLMILFSQLPIGVVVHFNYETLKESFESRAKSLITEMNKKLQGTERLSELEDEIDSLYSKLNVKTSINYNKDIVDIVDERGLKVFNAPKSLNEVIENKIDGAREEKNHLQKAVNLYKEVEEVYDRTAHEVRKTRSVPLIKELEDDYQGLDSALTKKLLKQKAWEDYYDVLGRLKKDLHDIAEAAKKYQEEGFEEYKEEEEEEEEEEKKEEKEEEKESTGSLKGEMTIELAYQVLGLKKGASIEKIKKKRRELSSVYHTDKNREELDDTMMKKINVAVDFLEEKKGS